jgi:hypothetical protein
MVPTCRPEKAARFVSGLLFPGLVVDASAPARIAAEP